jgi:hypothetical protein
MRLMELDWELEKDRATMLKELKQVAELEEIEKLINDLENKYLQGIDRMVNLNAQINIILYQEKIVLKDREIEILNTEIVRLGKL